MAASGAILGLAELKARIKAAPAIIQREIDAEIGFAAQNMANRAKSDAPGDQGFLRGAITAAKVGEGNWEVVSPQDYSAYVEFGTRGKAVVPPELQAYAAQFKGTGQTGSLSAKEAIYQWCKRQGIDEILWYPIYVSIMVNGINPHPFFFKQLTIEKPQLLERVNKILNSI